MFEIQKFNNEPQYGLMTRSDKEKLDALISASDTFLTKNIASDVFATKAEINNLSDTYATKKSTLAQIIASDTGFVFLNGVGEVVGTIPILSAGGKKNPNLTLSPTSVDYSRSTNYEITVTRQGSGAISATYDEYQYQTYIGSFEVNGNIFSFASGKDMATENITIPITITVAETDEYASATAICNVILTAAGGGVEAPEEVI